MLVKVAEHIFKIEGIGELRELLANFCPFEVDSGEEPLFIMELNADFVPPQTEAIVVFDYELSNHEEVRMQIFASGERTFSIKIGDVTYNMLCEYTSRWNFKCDAQLKNASRYIIDHFAVQAFSLATLPFETLLIHASTISYAQKSVLFLAESGTGKSTHTRLWRENIEGARLLNDDAPAVRIIDGIPTAFGTPWSGKLACWRNEEYPIRAMVRIRRAQFNKITSLSPLQAITALVPSCLPTLQRTDGDLDNIFSILSQIITSTEVYTLDCLPNPEAAQVANEALF